MGKPLKKAAKRQKVTKKKAPAKKNIKKVTKKGKASAAKTAKRKSVAKVRAPKVSVTKVSVTKVAVPKISVTKIPVEREAQEVTPALLVKNVERREPHRFVVGVGPQVKVQAVPSTIAVQLNEMQLNEVQLKEKQFKEPAPPIIVKTDLQPPSQLLLERFEWSGLPVSVPSHLRFFVSMAAKECQQASMWPFSYAKFLSVLPAKLCGRTFCCLLLSADFSDQEIAAKIGLTLEETSALRQRDNSQVLELFAKTCPEMYRKLGTQLAGVGSSLENVLERYLVAKVDRHFQVMIAGILLRLMREQPA